MTIFDKAVGPYRPLSWVLEFWPVLACSFVAALVTTAICKKIAIRFGIVDKPDAFVKTHKEPIAYLGGIGMLVGLTTGILAGVYFVQDDASFKIIFRMLLGIMAGATIACCVGVLDDIFDLKPVQKILGQLAAALALLAAGIRPNLNAITVFFGWNMPPELNAVLGVPVVIIFVLGATNSLNLLDGLDGLCAGVTAIIAVAMLLLAIHLGTWDTSAFGDPVRIIVALSLVGCCCGFLPFNRHPAKIFMGDAGSLLLGFIVATLMIMFGRITPRWWMASVVVFGLPILDTAVAIVRRLLNKRPLFVSDRGHIYDQMMDRGFTLKQTVLICYALAAMYAAIGLVMSQIRTRYAVVVYIAVSVISGIVVWKKGYLKMEGLRGAMKSETMRPHGRSSTPLPR